MNIKTAMVEGFTKKYGVHRLVYYEVGGLTLKEDWIPAFAGMTERGDAGMTERGDAGMTDEGTRE